MDGKIEEQLDLLNQVYPVLVDLAVNWSFKLLGAVVVIIAGFMIGRWVANLLLRVMEKRDVDTTLRQFIASAMRLVILIMFAVVALSQLGISITPLIAAIGGLAIGLSLALQGPVSNYGAGLVIILTRMYQIGDTITTQGCSGLVEDISLATTHLRAEDSELIVIPNKHIVGEIHINSDANRIIEGTIGIASNADVVQDAPPEVGIQGFGDSSIDLEYRYWTPTGSYFKTIHAVNLAILSAFSDEHITIPFPQREIRLLNEPS